MRRHGRLLLVQIAELGLEAGEPLGRSRVGLLLEGDTLDLELADPARDDVDLGGHGVDLDAKAARGLVDEVDGLVREEPARHVPVRQHRGSDEGRVLDAHAVMDLVTLLQSAQDRDRVGDRRLLDDDGLETALQRGVLLDVLAVLVERRRPDEAQFAARQHRLDHVAGIHGTLGGTGADDGVQLVDEGDDLAFGVRDLLQHRLQALLELPAVLRARHHRSEVEGDDPLVLQPFGDVAFDDASGESLDYRRLAHPGLADQDRVVLGAPRQDLHQATDLVVAPDDRVELALPGEVREVAAVALQRLVLLLGALRSHAMAATDRLERPEEIVTVDAETICHGEQQVLHREVLVAHLLAGGVRQIEASGQLTAERRFGCAIGLRDPGERLGDPVANRQRGDPQAVEEGDGNPAILGQRR